VVDYPEVLMAAPKEVEKAWTNFREAARKSSSLGLDSFHIFDHLQVFVNRPHYEPVINI
jgi:hypothetical protein